MKLKAIVSFVLAFLLTNGVISQTPARNIFAGGFLNYSAVSSEREAKSSTIEDRSITKLSVMPAAGIFLNDNLAVGSSLGYTYESQKRTIGSWRPLKQYREENIISINPFVRYYFGDRSAWFFAEASAGLGFGDLIIEVEDERVYDFVTFKLDLFISPGFYYYVKENLCIEAKLGFIGYTRYNEVDDENEFEYFETDFGINLTPGKLYFGIYYHF